MLINQILIGDLLVQIFVLLLLIGIISILVTAFRRSREKKSQLKNIEQKIDQLADEKKKTNKS